MAYTTAAKVRLLLIGIDSTVMSDVNVLTHVANADALINGYVGTVYALPFSTTPALIEKLSGEISAYLIMRTEFTRDAINMSQYLAEYEKAIKMLEDIRDSKILLFDSANAELAKSGNILHSNNENYNTTFDMADPLDQNIDARLLEDTATDRESED